MDYKELAEKFIKEKGITAEHILNNGSEEEIEEDGDLFDQACDFCDDHDGDPNDLLVTVYQQLLKPSDYKFYTFRYIDTDNKEKTCFNFLSKVYLDIHDLIDDRSLEKYILPDYLVESTDCQYDIYPEGAVTPEEATRQLIEMGFEKTDNPDPDPNEPHRV